MWWATLTFTCSLSLYPFEPREPECWAETSTSYEQVIVDQHRYVGSDPVKDFLRTLPEQKDDRK